MSTNAPTSSAAKQFQTSIPLTDMLYMDTDMELTKKTTILFPPDLFDQLSQLADKKGSSVGELVREACRTQYRLQSKADRLAIVAEMASLSLPVDTPAEMKRQSIPDLKPLP